ncbi:Amnionless [Cinara cedri]|uniref:Protein amnionless n=1 Tax=Cinara cedri TaxID=506608 RepID=A0A5E4MZ99_9HEMI|nr:Amnionless [Cinara cedri]
MPPRTIAVAAALLLSFSAGVADGATKKWTPNADFEDPGNWDAGRVPSAIDVVAFQEDTAVPVVLPSARVDVCELVLPVNGQLVLEPNSRVFFSASSGNATGGCTGRTVKFKRNAPTEWTDPDNWSSENANCATPHVERIPCAHDTVAFNPGNSFSVVVPDVPIIVGAVKYGNQTFSQNELNEFLVSDIGDQEFKSTSPNNDVSIKLTEMLCDDSTGCECGTLEYIDQVCKLASKRCDIKNLGCISPVQPIGHCCRICGAYFSIRYNPSKFDILKFNKEFKTDTAKIKSYKKYKIFDHTGKLSNGNIQIVLASDDKYVDEVNEFAKTVNSILISYIERDLGITDVEMFGSGLSYNVDGMTYGQIALTTCTIIISCMMAIIFYYTNDWKSFLFRSGSDTGAVFVKFENNTNDVELINESRGRLHQRKSSFENPTYGAMENLNQTQTFSDDLSYSHLAVSSMMPINAMDVELKETSEQK